MKLCLPVIQVQSEWQESWFKEEVQRIGSFSSDWEGLTIRNLQFLHKLRPAYWISFNLCDFHPQSLKKEVIVIQNFQELGHANLVDGKKSAQNYPFSKYMTNHVS